MGVLCVFPVHEGLLHLGPRSRHQPLCVSGWWLWHEARHLLLWQTARVCFHSSLCLCVDRTCHDVFPLKRKSVIGQATWIGWSFSVVVASFNSNYNDQKMKKMMGIYQMPSVHPVSWLKIQNSMNMRWKYHCTLRQGLSLEKIFESLKKKKEKKREEGYSIFPWNMATGICLSEWPHGKQRLGLVWQAVLSIKDGSLHFVCNSTIKRTGDQDSDVSLREICYSARLNEAEHTISYRG